MKYRSRNLFCKLLVGKNKFVILLQFTYSAQQLQSFPICFQSAFEYYNSFQPALTLGNPVDLPSTPARLRKFEVNRSFTSREPFSSFILHVYRYEERFPCRYCKNHTLAGQRIAFQSAIDRSRLRRGFAKY